jgi:uncharacterized protein YyaL (SSP411 family)
VTTNRLSGETSPYLLQHAHNPVDWYPWGDEALQRAREEDKPILVSIGYAACHWCHVMERESFEDPVTAAVMNRDFINVKIDREERPDLDHIYMDALQVLSGHGGWPLNVFLTPDARPFYGGTYFPPMPAHGRPSWQDVLRGIAVAFRERRAEVEEQAEKLLQHMAKAEAIFRAQDFGLRDGEGTEPFSRKDAEAVAENLLKSADRRWGGFGRAPKFPQTYSIRYLLRHHRLHGDEDALKHAMLSLDGMLRGGIYDQAGGGFARYSTDNEWLVPHFEKMTYDNALLVSVLSEAYQSTGSPRYAEAVRETIGFMSREMAHPEGGFHSALDADSEGVEGKYYTWTRAEVEDVLTEDAETACRLFGITEEGNWEHVNILYLPKGLEAFSQEAGIPMQELLATLERYRSRLLSAREERVRPLLDDKVILGWNALMVTALCKAGCALGEIRYVDMAERCMDFLETRLRDPDSGDWMHTYKAGKARFPAFLDDLAFLIEALLHLQESTGQPSYLEKAVAVAETVMARHGSSEGALFHFTPEGQKDLVIRKTDFYDGATASGNSTMAWNLYRLSFLSGRSEWRRKAGSMLQAVRELVTRHSTSFGNWAALGQEWTHGTWEISVVGPEAMELGRRFLGRYVPNKVFQMSRTEDGRHPLLRGRGEEHSTLWYVCRDQACLPPLRGLEELMQRIEEQGSRRS